MRVASLFLDVRKRGRHARTVCTLLQKWSNGSSVVAPFFDDPKRDAATITELREHLSKLLYQQTFKKSWR